MHSLLIAQFGQHQRPDDIAAHRLDPVALAPVDVRPSGLAGAVDDASRAELVEDLAHARLVFHADLGGVHDLALGFEQGCEVAADPALAAGEEEAVFLVHLVGPCWWVGCCDRNGGFCFVGLSCEMVQCD
jgi:hypothetical protein